MKRAIALLLLAISLLTLCSCKKSAPQQTTAATTETTAIAVPSETQNSTTGRTQAEETADGEMITTTTESDSEEWIQDDETASIPEETLDSKPAGNVQSQGGSTLEVLDENEGELDIGG